MPRAGVGPDDPAAVRQRGPGAPNVLRNFHDGGLDSGDVRGSRRDRGGHAADQRRAPGPGLVFHALHAGRLVPRDEPVRRCHHRQLQQGK